MTAKFIGEEGSLQGEELAFEEGLSEWTMGRDPDTCELVVEDPAVSRKHLVIRSSEDGFILENLRPTNPVEVNNEVVEGPVPLTHGDSVRVGGVVMRFMLDTPVEGAESMPDAPEAGAAAPEGAEAAKAAPQTATMVAEEEEEDEEDELEEVLSAEELEREHEELTSVDLSSLEGSRWMLKVVAGPNTGAEFMVEPGQEYVIGTDSKDCDVIFHDISVSRHHAKLTVTPDERFIIADMKSRNGVLVDGEPIESERKLENNMLVTLGTTAFLLCDREGEAITVSSPVFASVGGKAQEDGGHEGEDAAHAAEESRKGSAFSGFILLAMVSAVLVVLGMSAMSLFRTEQVQEKQVNYQEVLAEALIDSPQIQYNYSPSNGRLMLIGHVLTKQDRDQILYKIGELDWVRSVDNNIVVDELIWQENNQVMNKNPDWQGVTMMSPRPGVFVLKGFLKTRAQADQLNTYMNLNFPYPGLLERQVVVEENVISEATTRILERKLGDVAAEFINGEISLTGTVAYDRADDLKELVRDLEQIQGVKAVRNFVIELAEEEAMINLSDQYEVTGFSNRGEVSLNVVINGRIIARGDTLDGMTVTAIRPESVFLEKDGFKYRIDYKK